MHKVSAFTQLSKEERIKIEVLLHQGLTYSGIARELKRSVSTISREVGRNKGRLYQADRAQQKALRRHREKQKHRVFDQGMKQFIQEKLLSERLSPELISVAGKKLRGDFISGEWIYQWIWEMKFSQSSSDRCYSHLYEQLRHASRKRKRGNKRRMRGNILERHWIEERPEVVEQRKRKGDMEADIMLGKDRKPGLLVLLDRKSRKTWIRHLKNKDSNYVMGKVAAICKTAQVKTITFDNDQSFAQHYKLQLPTFFTHPYSSQEKGSVENRIGVIRMFFPKQTDFTKVSPAQVRQVQNLINNRPLRMFNYKTPNELYN
jgi:IS30 family transposase